MPRFEDMYACILAVILLVLLVKANQSGASESLRSSCFDKPYIAILAETKDRKSEPDVGLTLFDPSGRMQGKLPEGTSATQIIPGSHYGGIEQLPGSSIPSLARAVEVCGAEQGVYTVTVKEGNQPYSLSVDASGKTVNRTSLNLRHVSRQARVRTYKFVFRIDGNATILSWLDSAGSPQLRIEDGEW